MPEAAAGPWRSEYADDVKSFTDLLMTDSWQQRFWWLRTRSLLLTQQLNIHNSVWSPVCPCEPKVAVYGSVSGVHRNTSAMMVDTEKRKDWIGRWNSPRALLERTHYMTESATRAHWGIQLLGWGWDNWRHKDLYSQSQKTQTDVRYSQARGGFLECLYLLFLYLTNPVDLFS